MGGNTALSARIENGRYSSGRNWVFDRAQDFGLTDQSLGVGIATEFGPIDRFEISWCVVFQVMVFVYGFCVVVVHGFFFLFLFHHALTDFTLLHTSPRIVKKVSVRTRLQERYQIQ